MAVIDSYSQSRYSDLDTSLESLIDGIRKSSLDWMDDAVCKGRTHLFFPPKAERPQARVRREAHARRLCQSCPVRVECQAFARDHREYGYWGGESEEERHLAGFTVAAPIGVRSRAMRQAS